MRRLLELSLCAGWACLQAHSLAQMADARGLWTGLLGLFFGLLANQLVATWLRGH